MWILAVPLVILLLPSPPPKNETFLSPTFAVKPCELVFGMRDRRGVLRLCVSPKAQGGGMYILEV